MRATTLERCWLLAAIVFVVPRLGIGADVRDCYTTDPQGDSHPKPDPDNHVEAFREEEVHFASDGHILAGVLTMPVSPGPHPAVAFVHGSGALNRNDWTLHPTLREHFARHGIASLCWDKPGVGASGGDWTRQSFKDRAQEALDAIKLFRGRREIDPNRVGLWGISQGGWICPLAASLSADVKFMILISAPAGTIAEQDLFRVEQGMRADGKPNEDIARALNFARRRLELVRTGTFDDLDAAQQKVADQKWFTDYVHRLGPRDFAFAAKNIAYDGRAALERVKCPVLIVVGDRDTVVPSQQGATIIKDTLTKAGNPDVTVTVLSGGDHFLKPTKTGGPTEMNRDADLKTFVAGYESTVTDWLLKR